MARRPHPFARAWAISAPTPSRNAGGWTRELAVRSAGGHAAELPVRRATMCARAFLPASLSFSSRSWLRPVRAAARCSSTATYNNDAGDPNRKGEECYAKAMEALQNAARAKHEHDERLRQEQFDAVEKQRARTRQRQRSRSEGKTDPRLERLRERDDNEGTKDRAAGVAVVRTIVKQSQASRDVQIDKWDGSRADTAKEAAAAEVKQPDEEERWQQVAQEHMAEAAYRYGHRLALVRLGNEALELAKDDSLFESLIDREKCEEWIDESPIDLATVLELGNGIEGNAHEKNGADSPSPCMQLALQLYEEAGKRGSHEGWYNLGHLLWDGPDATHPAKEKAMEAFHKAMELEDADAMYFVGAQYLSYEEGGDGADASFLKESYDRYGPEFLSTLQSTNLASSGEDELLISSLANELQQHGYILLQLAALGHSHGPALHHLALLHNQHENAEEFRALLSKAAETGNPDSLFLLGHCHYFGTDGYAQDFRKALESFVAAGEHGNADAMVSAGAMLHQGVVGEDGRTVIIHRDQQRAFDLYQQAGELGSIEGWRNVVSCYATGEGVPKCIDTARHIADTMLKDNV